MSNKTKLIIFYLVCILIIVLALVAVGLTSCRPLSESEKQELNTKELVVYNYTKDKQLLKTRCYSIDVEDTDTYLEIYAYMEDDAYQYYLVYKQGDDIRYTFG